MKISGLGNNYPTNDAGNGNANVVRRGRFFSQLQAADPQTQKTMLSDMAGKLRTRASAMSGDRAARLTQQADMLDKAASTGDLSQLQQSWDNNGQWHARTHSSR